MYLPNHFAETRPDVLHRLVREQPLGMLITTAADGPRADTIPFLLDVDDATGAVTLRGHVARANPLWRDSRPEVDALVVFQGPQAYISPSMYPTKAAHGKVVPTWNYVMVQARGPLRAIEDAGWLHALVTRLTTRHEATRPVPWAVSDAPPEYIDSMLRAIVGIEIPVAALTGKWKVTQNRAAVDRDGVVQGLREQAARDGDTQAAAQANAMAALVAAGPAPKA